jgi:uncharacterized protein (TIGR02300 family)
MQLEKAKRGTKRVCPECNTRFYDLLRESIPCPSCGVQFVAAARPAVEAAALPTSHALKTGWRGKPYKRPEPVRQPDLEPDLEIASEAAVDDGAIDSTTEETPGLEPDNNAVLEHELDDEDDVSNLVDHQDNGEQER